VTSTDAAAEPEAPEVTLARLQAAASETVMRSARARSAVAALEARMDAGDETVSAQEVLDARHEAELAGIAERIARAGLAKATEAERDARAHAAADRFKAGYAEASAAVRERLAEVLAALEEYGAAVQGANDLVSQLLADQAVSDGAAGGRFKMPLLRGLRTLDGRRLETVRGDMLAAAAMAPVFRRQHAAGGFVDMLKAFGDGADRSLLPERG